MTITSEQFNKIALKEDTERIEGKIDSMAEGINNLVDSMDMQKKKLDDIEHAFVSNQAAHDRLEKRISRIEKHLELKPIF